MYRNKPKGINFFGKLLDSILLSLPSVKATRVKKKIIIKILQNEVANNIILDCQGYLIDGTGVGGVTEGIYLSRGSLTNTNTTIKNCRLSGWYPDAIYIQRASNNIILNNTIDSSDGYTSIYNYGSTNNNIENNTISGGSRGISLETYFTIRLIGKQENGDTRVHVFQDGDGYWRVKPIFAMHVISSSEEMASYGISFQRSSGYNVLMPTDTQHMMPPQLEAHYRKADRIYMDCETSSFPSGVHPHISDLINRMDPAIQKKCLLYHYDQEPKVPEDMFCGILKAGDAHTYPE